MRRESTRTKKRRIAAPMLVTLRSNFRALPPKIQLAPI
jgi:hypothetical protein